MNSILRLHYQHRWWYAGILCLGLLMVGYFYVFHEKVMELLKIKDEIDHLQQLLKISQRYDTPKAGKLSSKATFKTQPELTNDLYNTVRSHGLLLKSLNIIPDLDNNHSLRVHLNLIGSFKANVSFIRNLADKPYPLSIVDFELRPFEDQFYEFVIEVIVLKGDLTEINHHHVSIDDDSSSISNPFCHSNNGLMPIRSLDFNSLPLAQLKMTGYFEYDQKAFAILMFSNQYLQEIKEGEIIGREAGTVTRISKDKINVRFKNGSTQIIQLQK